MKVLLTIFIILILLTIIPKLVMAADEKPIHFCAVLGDTGCSTSFSNDGSYNSLKITKVDPGLLRLQIMDTESKKVLFDKMPTEGLTIDLTKGDFTAIGWTSEDIRNDDAVEAVLVGATTEQSQAPATVTYPQVSRLRPFSPEANYMSLPGLLRFLVYQRDGIWLSREEAVAIVQQQMAIGE